MKKANFTPSDIMDDYMFQNVMEQPANCQMFLQSVFPKRKLVLVKVKSQDRVNPTDFAKTTIMDIWAKDDRGRLYDIEMQVAAQRGRDARAEFYAARLIGQTLHKGENYQQSRRSCVIFIFPFDPFHDQRRKYTIKNQVVETRQAHFQGKSEIIYLNSKGTKGTVSADLQDFFGLMNGHEVPEHHFIKQIQDSMAEVGQTTKWEARSMALQYRIAEAERKAAANAAAKAKEETTAKVTTSSIKKSIKLARRLGANDQTILKNLSELYAGEVSEAELKALIEETD
jgi:predicted transposase/invertase (TIGR01784 family)